MKNISFSVFLLFFSSISGYAQGGWEWQNPKPTGNNLKDAHFINAQNAWAVGDIGTIIKTTNGGTDWSVQISGTALDLTSIHFVDTETGWAVGDSGTILKTIDGGTSWINQSSSVDKKLNSVFFSDAQNGWAVGSNGTILKTNVGGNLWVKKESGVNSKLNSIFFSDAQIGWAVGANGIILKSTNGGETWNALNSGTGVTFNSLHFVNSQTGWVVGESGVIIKTTNGGTNWLNQTSGTTGFNSVKFLDAQNGWTTGVNGSFLKTSDGGGNWTTQTNTGNDSLFSVNFSSALTGYVFGNKGVIMKTSNGGNTWDDLRKFLAKDFNLNAVAFPTPFIGFATGYFSTGGSSGNLIGLKTVDGGTNWNIYSESSFNYYLPSFYYFFNDQIGWSFTNCDWCVGGGAPYSTYASKTTNGGVTWDAGVFATKKSLSGFHFVDSQTGYYGTDTLYKTTNGGSTWIKQEKIFPNTPTIFKFLNSQVGWKFGGSGSIFKTIDGGNSWQPQTSGTSNSLYKMSIVNAQVSYICGENGTILKTTNGGTNWQSLAIGTNESINFISFKTSEIGTVVSSSGDVYQTKNGGTTWIKTSSKPKNFTRYSFSDDQNGWWVGPSGSIVRTRTGGVIPCQSPNITFSGLNGSQATYCNSVSINQPVKLKGSTGGTFSVLPSGLDINASTGSILPSASMPGTYLVSYTVPASGACPAFEATAPVTILESSYIASSRLDTVRSAYYLPAGTSFQPCLGDTFFLKAKNLYPGLDVNWYKNGALLSDTGNILPVTSSGTYGLRYKNGGCLSQYFDTTRISFLNQTRPPKPLVNINQQPANCNQSFTLFASNNPALSFQWIYAGSVAASASSNQYTSNLPGKYQLRVKNAAGCYNISNPFTVQSAGIGAQVQPGIFSVSTIGNSFPELRNQISWYRNTATDTSVIKRILIYREAAVANQYVQIGDVPAIDTAFTDPTGNPLNQPYFYRIAVKRQCPGVQSISLQSTTHKSIHLQISYYPPNFYNLIWTKYEGFNVSSYKVYRGNTFSADVEIATVSGNVNSYTDIPPTTGGPYFYKVEALTNDGYTPFGRINAIIRKSLSNIKNQTQSFCDTCGLTDTWPIYTGVQTRNTSSDILVFPNPHRDGFTLQLQEAKSGLQVHLIDIQGRLRHSQIIGNDEKVINLSTQNMKSGLYILNIVGENFRERIKVVKE